MLKGSCACGAVRYEIPGELIGPVTCCHCRKHSGSSFGTTAGVKTDEFVIVSGEAEMHFMTGSKGPWVEIHDSLRQVEKGVPFGERD